MRSLPKLLTFFSATALALSGCAAGDAPSAAPLEKIVFAGVALDDNPDVSARYQILMDLISEATGLPVEFYEAPDYAGIIEGVTSGRANFAQLDGLGYVLATNQSEEVSLVASYSRAPDQEPGLKSYAITQADSDIDSLDDVKGGTVCFPDPSSSSGYLWPAKGLLDAGLNPDPLGTSDFVTVITGSHASVGVSVQNRDCDLGFLADNMWDRVYPTSDLVDITQMKKVWESVLIPAGPLLAHSNVPADVLDTVYEVLIEQGNKDYMVEQGLCDDRESCPFLAAASWGYVPVEESIYDVVREVCAALEAEQCS